MVNGLVCVVCFSEVDGFVVSMTCLVEVRLLCLYYWDEDPIQWPP